VDHFYRSIKGWCDFADFYAAMVARAQDGAHFVEVGVWAGQSTAALAVEIINSGKVIRLDVVDHFQGSPEITEPLADQRAEFEANIQPVRHVVREVHAEKSWAAARRYADASLDFVFIDAAHDTASVLKDLEAWWPKIKPGGILAGHDVDFTGVQCALKPWSEASGVRVETASRACWLAIKPQPIEAAAWAVPEDRRKCLVAVCSNERTIYRKTAENLLTLGWGQRVLDATRAHGFRDLSVTWVSRFVLVSDLRNEAARLALAGDFSHVLFLDADMEWPTDVLSRMLAHHDRGIVSGLYFLKTWPHHPVALGRPRINPDTLQVDYTYIQDAHVREGVVPASLVGMGCALVPTAVFSRLREPWFEYQTDRNGAYTVTEDVAFCQRAAAHGVPIWVDPDVVCRHISQESVGPSHYDRALFEKAMLEQQARVPVVAGKPMLVRAS
jgi:predicted O-methyltransferase YrrM